MKLVFRRRTEEYTLELINPEEIDRSVEEIVKTETRGLLRDKNFLKRTLSDQESTITIVAKKKEELKGVINGVAMRNQPINPRITFVWVKDRESAIKGVPRMLIDRFSEEARKRNPEASSIEVGLPTFDVDSITLYSMSGFLIQGFIRGTEASQDIVIMRRASGRKPQSTTVV